MTQYDVFLRLQPEPDDEFGPFKRAPIDAANDQDAERLALAWMNSNTPEHYKAEELWLHEGAGRTLIWSRAA